MSVFTVQGLARCAVGAAYVPSAEVAEAQATPARGIIITVRRLSEVVGSSPFSKGSDVSIASAK
jgi:hypothetical protein